MTMQLRDGLERVNGVVRARRNAEEYEIVVERYERYRYEASGGRSHSMLAEDTYGYGVRVVRDGSEGYAYSLDWSAESIASTVDYALAAATLTTSARRTVLPELREDYDASFALDDVPSVATAQALVETCEDAARSVDARVRPDQTLVETERLDRVIGGSRGGPCGYRTTHCHCDVWVLAVDGDDRQSGRGFRSARIVGDLDAAAAGRAAAVDAITLLGGRAMPSRRTAVVLDGTGAALLLRPLALALEGDRALEGRSMFSQSTGRNVGASTVSIVDDGRAPLGRSSAPYDGEGVATNTTPLVVEGVVEQFLHSTTTADAAGATSTGNALRASVRKPPAVGASTLFLAPGIVPGERIRAGVADGVWVRRIQGVHSGADPLTGDFSIGVTGVWLDQGRATRPVTDMRLSGNLTDLLERVECVGSDLTIDPVCGYGLPTICVGELTIG